LGVGTTATYLNRLRVSAERAPAPPVEFEIVNEAESLLKAHRDAGVDATGAFEKVDARPGETGADPRSTAANRLRGSADQL